MAYTALTCSPTDETGFIWDLVRGGVTEEARMTCIETRLTSFNRFSKAAQLGLRQCLSWDHSMSSLHYRISPKSWCGSAARHFTQQEWMMLMLS